MPVTTRAITDMSRRRLFQGSAALSGVASLGFLSKQASAAKDLVVGFIYVGPKDDYGYNQAHAEAAALVKKMDLDEILELSDRIVVMHEARDRPPHAGPQLILAA